MPYNGKDNNDYVDGKGFCCNDVPANAPQKAARANDNPELYQYYYHPDHLGSSSFITNLDGDVAQHIEYVPYGEVFIEERNNVWNTPYLFNAKELDEETGLYYYGARYYDPRTSVWISVDPLAEIHPNMSSYVYCGSNPINYIDVDGMDSTYFDSKGNTLHSISGDKGKTDRIFVVKTTKSTNDMYGDGNYDQKGKTSNITDEEATNTEDELKKGSIIGEHMKNVVYVADRKQLDAMLSSIKDDGTGGSEDDNNREFSGNFSGNKVTNAQKSDVGNPLKGNNLVTKGNPKFHSHPSGNVKFEKKGKHFTASWIQPPSKQDIKTANGTEFVVGMGSKTIYIFDKKGVKATIPISTVKKK